MIKCNKAIIFKISRILGCIIAILLTFFWKCESNGLQWTVYIACIYLPTYFEVRLTKSAGNSKWVLLLLDLFFIMYLSLLIILFYAYFTGK